MSTTSAMMTSSPRSVAAGWGLSRAGAALLGLVLTAANATVATAADVPGDSGTKAVLRTGAPGVQGTFERKADSDWYRVTLKGGQNYAFHALQFLECSGGDLIHNPGMTLNELWSILGDEGQAAACSSAA